MSSTVALTTNSQENNTMSSTVASATNSQENNTMSKENNTMSQENNTMSKENNTMSKENNTMSKENNTMSKENNTMSKENNTMSNMTDAMNNSADHSVTDNNTAGTMNNTAEAPFDSKIEHFMDNAPIPSDIRDSLRRKWHELKDHKVNILIVGATGCGKSSTINALSSTDSANVEEVAMVGSRLKEITKYEIDNMVFWDTPGLGDGKGADMLHESAIIDKLNERDSNGKPLIDLVLVILNGSTRDLGTSYTLINKLIPHLGDDKDECLLVAINQADAAMNGRHWDYDQNKPDAVLKKFLDEKCESVRRRIFEGTGVNVAPIYYSAGYKEEGGVQEPPYNIAELHFYILTHIPMEKRLVVINNVNKDADMPQDNDKPDYKQNPQELTEKNVAKWMAEGTMLEITSGSIIPSISTAVGTAVGTVLGGVSAFINSLFDW